MAWTSEPQMPAVWIATRTSPGPGTGSVHLVEREARLAAPGGDLHHGTKHSTGYRSERTAGRSRPTSRATTGSMQSAATPAPSAMAGAAPICPARKPIQSAPRG